MTKLDKCWINCLRMWKWIASLPKEKFDNSDIEDLKNEWLEKYRFTREVRMGCFFCDYAGEVCDKCPGRLVGKRFSCMNNTYYYRRKPKAFYKKLVQLNKKRNKK